MTVGEARRCLGRSGSHNGGNQRQRDGCRYADPAYDDATGRTFNTHFWCDKQMGVRQPVQGQQYHGFVYKRAELPREGPCDLRWAAVSIA